jgi:hypothetical protein
VPDHFELSLCLNADSDRLRDENLGLLLDALQIGSGVTADPERFRQALALVAQAEPLVCVA